MQISEKKHGRMISLDKAKEILLCFFLFLANSTPSQIYIQNDSLFHISGGATVIINGKKFDNKKTNETDSTKIYIVEGTVVYNWDNDKIEMLSIHKNKNELGLLSKNKKAQQKLQEKYDAINTRHVDKIPDSIDEPYNEVLFINTLNIASQGCVVTQVHRSMFTNNDSVSIPKVIYEITKILDYYDLDHTRSFSEIHTTRPPPFLV